MTELLGFALLAVVGLLVMVDAGLALRRSYRRRRGRRDLRAMHEQAYREHRACHPSGDAA